ncbi:MAG TPA: quinolinate synthase NadA [Blastocatellia bacterium]|nr:quinolinate synthase NadA [Blastocatellia bacterium]
MVPVLGNETSADRLYRKLQEMLGDVVPDFELKLKADLAAEINQLKIQKKAVILGHNYMEPALFHSIPDYVGDSLDLARKPLVLICLVDNSNFDCHGSSSPCTDIHIKTNRALSTPSGT